MTTRDENDPGPLDVRAEARRQARILAEFRAWQAAGFPAKPRPRAGKGRGRKAAPPPPGSMSAA